MKTFFILLTVLQVVLYLAGVHQIIEGNIYLGLFNVTVNACCIVVNVYNIKRHIEHEAQL